MATSAAGVLAAKTPSVSAAAAGWRGDGRELERDWDAYKTSRSCTTGGPPPSRRHRRSRSATGTPSSAVVTAEPAAAAGLVGLWRRGSPRQLVSSLQRTGSSSGSCGTANAGGVTAEHGGKNQISCYDKDDPDAASSVCSADASTMAAMAMATSSYSCSCSCAVRRCGCGYCYPSNSSCSDATSSLFSLRDEEAVVGEATKTDEARWAMGSVGRFVAIAAVGLVLVAAIATAILELAWTTEAKPNS
ncbi:hypothetical protein E2562_015053 [Oryza meyeriana var. granulata]|uniref:Uncharacterized protein n=1 Tax=Oryza meyeriana var. granulata TaxID=110450 RepID=A0A6G1EJI4_9ORYZ|nr:hypothetical protein E2562_015053 [Oryza meyeriana var. granulata]